MKKILIIDEIGFSRVCSAILELEGHKIEIFKNKDLLLRLRNREFGLIITSYPYGSFLFKEIKKMNLPTIILTAHINKDLINLFKNLSNSYCMIKPLDYQKFRSLVNQVVSCDTPTTNGFNLL